MVCFIDHSNEKSSIFEPFLLVFDENLIHH